MGRLTRRVTHEDRIPPGRATGLLDRLAAR
ncbi:hypothetical protein P405_29690 [Streptomyces sp. FR-008]|nr:hypothetical protein P405_29690 [Streptomyces sp. FR-008]